MSRDFKEVTEQAMKTLRRRALRQGEQYKGLEIGVYLVCLMSRVEGQGG